MSASVGSLARPVTVYRAMASLHAAIPALETGHPVIVEQSGEPFFLLPQAAVGHQPSRRLVDLPLERALQVSSDTSVDEALEDLCQANRDYLAVSDAQNVMGVVSREQMVAHVAFGADVQGWALLSRVANNVRDGVVLLDPTNHVSFANPAGRRLLGGLTSEGDGPVERLGAHSLAELLQRGPDKPPLDVVVDGKTTSVLVLAAPDEEPASVLLVLRDVTRIRRRQEEGARRDRMVVMGELASAMAHDFNNLLTALLGTVEQLKSDAPEGSAQAESAEEATQIVLHGARLVRDLLAFASREVVRPTAVDVQQVLRDFGPVLKRIVGPQVEIRTSLEPVPAILGTVGQVERVVANLAMNSRHAMTRGGRLTVAVAPHEQSDRDGLKLTVEDTGVGISPDALKRIFEPYFTTRPGRGSGLGLASVHGTVEQLGGTISVLSTPGEGTRFDIFLPAADAPIVSAAPLSARDPRSTHVYVLDADSLVGRSVRRKLEPYVSDVTLVADLVELAAKLSQCLEPAVVVVGLRPESDDLGTLRRLELEHPTVRFVLMSGQMPLREVEFASVLLPKPFTDEQLLDAVAGAVRPWTTAS